MSAIAIKDLTVSRILDRKAMSSVKGSGAPWVFGCFAPYVPATPSQLPVFNFYQINNYAQQMNNQFQTVDVSNSAPNSLVSVVVNEQASNAKQFHLA